LKFTRKENVMADTSVPNDSQHQPYVVLSFSRATLASLGFTDEQIARLTDEDMQRLAYSLEGRSLTGFYETLKFTVSVFLVAKRWPSEGQGEIHESTA
jgi:hypothetical protein